MSDVLEVGSIINGKVINVKPYGAFISIGDDKKGLVHISHISDDFVKDINQFLHQGDRVKVKVLSIDDNGKIALSLKEAVGVDVDIKQEMPKQMEKEKSSIEVRHKCLANLQERISNEPKKAKTLEELLKDYNRQANDKQVDINRRLKR